MAVDLHTHSLASDGTLDADAVVRLASSIGLHAIAVCDHDSVEGISRAVQAGQVVGIPVVPGVEFSAIHEGLSIHILGYFIDHDHAPLLKSLADLRNARMDRAKEMVARLAEDGFTLDFNDILQAVDGGAIGRAHVAAALVRSGHASDLESAFARFVGRDAPYFVPKPPMDIANVIATIHDSGGLAVVAHPGVTGVDEYIDHMVAVGLDGIEALHAEHSNEQRARYSRIATDYGLLITGGSDFHGPDMAGCPLGAGDVPDEVYERLLEAARGTSRPVLH